jgi:glycosyltransferase involved in cell wall biosynthesis
MKVTYIASSIIPSRAANSIHVMKMCNALSSLGHKVELLIPNRKDGLELNVDDIYEYYGVDDRFSVKKLWWPDFKGKNYVYGLIAAFYAVRSRSNLIICRNLYASIFSSLAGRDVFFEVHQPIIDSGRISEWIFSRLISRKNFKRLIVITHSLKKYYEQRFPELVGQICVAPDGADPIIKDSNQGANVGISERLQVGYVGHLYPGKGMEVISKLAPLYPLADFHVVGGSEKDLMDWSRRCNDVPNLKFHGYVPHAQTNSFITSFDVLLLPNQERVFAHGEGRVDIGRWTSPLKAFEYMAHSKPIISSNIPVLTEVFIDNVNSILCKPDNINDWVQALEKLDSSIELRERLSKAACSIFLEKYTWQARAKYIIRAYDACL